MEIGMTLSSVATMFGAMLALAIIPDSSALAVVARSIASGLTHALVTILGIVVGDFIFIIFAVYGLSSLAESNLFVLIKYLGGAYLISAGIALWVSKSEAVKITGVKELSWVTNFLCGLLITLGDPKAILFYISFLPAFLDFAKVTVFDTGIIMALAAITAGGTKLSYALMADKAQTLFNRTQAKAGINRVAGSIMICTGIYLILKS